MSSNSPAPGDSEAVVQDLGPLAWVLDELRRSLDGSTKAIRRFVRDAELARGSDISELDASHLRIARQQLHQAVGALEMVGMEAPAKVLRSMEALAQRFVQQPELCSDEAANKVERASFALAEYLEGVLKGKTASSVALFPQYRAVQELVGADRIHPADLWPVEWRWATVSAPSATTALQYEPGLRSQMDRAVLKLVKSGDVEGAKRMQSVCAGLCAAQTTLKPRTFWAIGAAYFEAMSLALCPTDGFTKRAASRILQQYAALAKGDPDISDRLAQDLVFYCSVSVPAADQNAPWLNAVRLAYGLVNNKAIDYETEQFGRFDPALLVLTRKRIAAAAETWSALAGGDTHRLKVASEQFGVLAESMVKLHPEASELARALVHAIDATVRSGVAPAPAVAMEVATAVLYLEAAYEDLDPTESHLADRSARLAQRLEHVTAGGQQEPMEAWMEELYRRVSDRQTMGSVVDELRTAMGEVEKSLDQFFRDPKDKAPLREVPNKLGQMRGVFSVLGLDQPSLAALRMRSSVEQFLMDDAQELGERAEIFEKLGNSLGAMGFLIDMLSYQRALAKTLFVYDEDLGEFKPLMGRERVAVQAPAIEPMLEATPEVAVPGPVLALIPEELVPVATVAAVPVPVDDTSDDDAELLDIFMEEAREVVQTGRDAVKSLAMEPTNLAEQTTLRRAFHTLKGSSRMVGLTDFGEAAWSFEQLLNASLAEQRPASDALIMIAGSAMLAFGRWVEDIASGSGVEWSAADFRRSSDALRLDGKLIALRTPGEPEPIVDQPLTLATTAEEAAQVDLVEDQPDTPDQFASTQLVDSLDFGVPEAKVDFAATQMFEVEPEGAAQPEEDRPDFAATQHFDFQADAAFASYDARTESGVQPDAPPPKGVTLGEFDFENLSADGAEGPETVVPEMESVDGALPVYDAPPEPDAAPAVALDHLEFPPVAPGMPEPTVDAVEPLVEDEELEIDEQVKIIGTLRLSIPLYNVYLNEADEWSRRLQVELSEWSLELHKAVPDAAVTLAHSLGGSSATVGFSALSELARALEHALEHVQLHRQGRPEFAQVFVDSAEDIRRLLHQFAAGFLKEPKTALLEALRTIIETDFPAATMEEPAFALEEPEVPPEDFVVSEPDAQESPIALVPVALAEHAAAEPVPASLEIVDAQDDEIDAQDRLDADLFPIFEEEAAELLPQLGGALRQWVARPDNLSARSEVLRVLHTLKGSARLAGALRLGEMAHRMESSVEHIGSESLQSVQIEPLLTRFDKVQSTFEKLGTSPATLDVALPPVEAFPTAEGPGATVPVGASEAIPSAAPIPPRQMGNQSVRVRSQLLDRLVNQAGEVMITRSRMDARLTQFRASLDELGGNLDRLRQQLRDVEVQAESQMQSRLAQTKDSAQSFDPLEFDRFTRLQELTRMMAESVNDVATVQRNLQRSVEGTEDDLIAQGRQARELQRDLLRTRMVEFDAISERLYSVVRQAGKDTGKQVKLDILGGAIDMDRGVLDRMAPAFEHILRNSVAHGIESAVVREAAHKPAVGTITIQVSQEGNDVTVSFTDDGGGLHLDRIRAKAIANGLIGAQSPLTETEAANLIFMPGFSTAEQVTAVAGRGIGMDVVRSEVNGLGGRIETTTKVGQGSTFKLVLPLTTAVTQVVMLRMGDFTIGVPSNLMETVLRVPAKVLETAYQVDGFDMAGQLIPFFWGGALLQVSARSQEAQTKTLPVAVFRSAGQRLALHIDEVLGNREVVVKNLGPQLGRLPGLAGVSVLASGAVVLIYNPVALAAVYGELARQLRLAAADAATSPAEAIANGGASLLGSANEVPLVLVVDDSITVRRVTQRLLKREGYRVVLAADGLQALEKLQEEKPAVVLSDIEMPRMDGFDLARNIRADARLRDLPIIMITSRIAEKHREHAKDLGVDHYLGKPYSEDELLGLVRSYCSTPAEA